MPGRTWPLQTAADNTSAGTKPYRYGFNGKENDYEIKNSCGTSYDYGFRIYDSRLGKFLSVDPLTKEYPWYTPYQFAGNTPIQAIDIDGLEEGYLWKASGYYPDYNPQAALQDLGKIGKKVAVQLAEYSIGLIVTLATMGEGECLFLGTEEKVATGALEREVVADEIGATQIEVETSTTTVNKVNTATPNEFKPTEQLKGNKSAKAVGDIQGKMEANETIPPIEVAEIDGIKYTINGHHRVEAAIRVPYKLEYKVLEEPEWQAYGYKTEADIKSASAEVTTPKLDKKVITKAKEEATAKIKDAGDNKAKEVEKK